MGHKVVLHQQACACNLNAFSPLGQRVVAWPLQGLGVEAVPGCVELPQRCWSLQPVQKRPKFVVVGIVMLLAIYPRVERDLRGAIDKMTR